MPELATILQNKTRPEISSIGRSAIRQFDQEISDIPGILKLTLGEPDLNTPDHIKRIMINAINNNESHYAPSAGLPKLRHAVSKYLEDYTMVKYDPRSEVLITIGATEAIYATMQTILSAGDEVIIPTPVFPLYTAVATTIGARPIEVDTSATNFLLTPETLKEVLKRHPSAKMVILNYPTNPTGATYSQSQLRQLSSVIQDSQLFVMADEIYSELCYGNPHFSIASLLPERTVIINGISKSYAMTGYRIGYLAGPAPLIKDILKLHGFMVTTAPTSIMEGATEALLRGQKDIISMRKKYQIRRDYLIPELQKLGFRTSNAEGAFYLFAKIPDFLTQDSTAFALQLARKGKLAIIPGAVFGPGGEGYIRFSYAASMTNLHEAVQRLTKFIQEEK